jgi:hypothetical protein
MCLPQYTTIMAIASEDTMLSWFKKEVAALRSIVLCYLLEMPWTIAAFLILAFNF